MLKLARWSTTHRKYVVIGWIVLLVAINAFAQSAGTDYSNNFTLPNSDAQRAIDLLKASFPQQAGDRDTIVFKVSSGSVLEPAVRSRMSAMFASVEKLPHVTTVISPYAAASGGHAISADDKIAFATVVFNELANNLPNGAVERVVNTAQAVHAPGLDVELGGPAIESLQKPSIGSATGIGLLAAIIVLLITFGSLVAMSLPIVTALFGLGTGLGAIALFTHVVQTPNFSSELAAMIGLGVGIDYALFILTRFREAYAAPGPARGNVHESVVQAIDTAGRAVLFAGTTVVIALLGMMLLGIEFLYGVAISASIAVLLVMLGSLTLLPSLLTIAGTRVAVGGRKARKRAQADELAGVAPAAAAAGSGWLRWSRFVQRHPVPMTLAATLVMLAIAAPALALRLDSSDASNDPPNQTTHHAYELLAQGFGQGFNGPLQAVVKLPAGASPTSKLTGVNALRQAIAATADVAAVAPPRKSPNGDVVTLTIYPSSSPEAYATTLLVKQLRSSVIPPVARQTGWTVYIGGFTAGSVDFANTLAQKLPLFIGVVVLLSALLLMIVFRSLVIPLQAAVMNLLSIGASLGVIVAVFQWGWLGSLFNVTKGPVDSFIPVMLFAIVFGLSMDYEVFLISRIHERWTHNRNGTLAVGEGLALTGRVVTAAAAIMVCVFLSFMLGGSRVIEEFGLSLASAVFLDAVVVRCLLLPATLSLLGDVTWALPGWLDRLLPSLNIEGTASREEVAAGSQNGSHPGVMRHDVPEMASEGAEV